MGACPPLAVVGARFPRMVHPSVMHSHAERTRLAHPERLVRNKLVLPLDDRRDVRPFEMRSDPAHALVLPGPIRAAPMATRAEALDDRGATPMRSPRVGGFAGAGPIRIRPGK